MVVTTVPFCNFRCSEKNVFVTACVPRVTGRYCFQKRLSVRSEGAFGMPQLTFPRSLVQSPFQGGTPAYGPKSFPRVGTQPQVPGPF